MPINLNSLVPTLLSRYKPYLCTSATQTIGEPVHQSTIRTALDGTRLKPNLQPPIVPSLHLGMTCTGLAVNVQFSHKEIIPKKGASRF
jgi:hypothetical protein